MKSSTRTALIMGASVLGAGAVSYFRGRRGAQLLFDTALHGAAVGTGLSVVARLVLPDGQTVPVLALPNSHEGVQGMGKLGAEGIKLLSSLNVDKLYSDMDKGGVVVGPIPENDSIVIQAET